MRRITYFRITAAILLALRVARGCVLPDDFDPDIEISTVKDDYAVGEFLILYCPYVFEGSAFTYCLPTGWSPDISNYRCLGPCPAPVVPAHLRYYDPDAPGESPDEYQHGTVLTVECVDDSKVPSSQPSHTCTDTEWNVVEYPVCIEALCTLPDDLDPDIIVQTLLDEYVHNDLILLYCPPIPYSTRGTSYSVCTTGVWEPDISDNECLAPCDPPEATIGLAWSKESGLLRKGQYTHNTVLSFTCSIGQLEGSDQLTCTDGEWTSAEKHPSCLVTGPTEGATTTEFHRIYTQEYFTLPPDGENCTTYPTILDASLYVIPQQSRTNNTFIHGDSFLLYCNDTVFTPPIWFTFCWDARWYPDPSQRFCYKPCDLPAVDSSVTHFLSHSGVTPESFYLHGSDITFQCTSPVGSILIGPDSAVCREGVWAPEEVPTCEEVTTTLFTTPISEYSTVIPSVSDVSQTAAATSQTQTVFTSAVSDATDPTYSTHTPTDIPTIDGTVTFPTEQATSISDFLTDMTTGTLFSDMTEEETLTPQTQTIFTSGASDATDPTYFTHVPSDIPTIDGTATLSSEQATTISNFLTDMTTGTLFSDMTEEDTLTPQTQTIFTTGESDATDPTYFTHVPSEIPTIDGTSTLSSEQATTISNFRTDMTTKTVHSGVTIGETLTPQTQTVLTSAVSDATDPTYTTNVPSDTLTIDVTATSKPDITTEMLVSLRTQVTPKTQTISTLVVSDATDSSPIPSDLSTIDETISSEKSTLQTVEHSTRRSSSELHTSRVFTAPTRVQSTISSPTESPTRAGMTHETTDFEDFTATFTVSRQYGTERMTSATSTGQTDHSTDRTSLESHTSELFTSETTHSNEIPETLETTFTIPTISSTVAASVTSDLGNTETTLHETDFPVTEPGLTTWDTAASTDSTPIQTLGTQMLLTSAGVHITGSVASEKTSTGTASGSFTDEPRKTPALTTNELFTRALTMYTVTTPPRSTTGDTTTVLYSETMKTVKTPMVQTSVVPDPVHVTNELHSPTGSSMESTLAEATSLSSERVTNGKYSPTVDSLTSDITGESTLSARTNSFTTITTVSEEKKTFGTPIYLTTLQFKTKSVSEGTVITSDSVTRESSTSGTYSAQTDSFTPHFTSYISTDVTEGQTFGTPIVSTEGSSDSTTIHTTGASSASTTRITSIDLLTTRHIGEDAFAPGSDASTDSMLTTVATVTAKEPMTTERVVTSDRTRVFTILSSTSRETLTQTAEMRTSGVGNTDASVPVTSTEQNTGKPIHAISEVTSTHTTAGVQTESPPLVSLTPLGTRMFTTFPPGESSTFGTTSTDSTKSAGTTPGVRSSSPDQGTPNTQTATDISPLQTDKPTAGTSVSEPTSGTEPYVNTASTQTMDATSFSTGRMSEMTTSRRKESTTLDDRSPGTLLSSTMSTVTEFIPQTFQTNTYRTSPGHTSLKITDSTDVTQQTHTRTTGQSGASLGNEPISQIITNSPDGTQSTHTRATVGSRSTLTDGPITLKFTDSSGGTLRTTDELTDRKFSLEITDSTENTPPTHTRTSDGSRSTFTDGQVSVGITDSTGGTLRTTDELTDRQFSLEITDSTDNTPPTHTRTSDGSTSTFTDGQISVGTTDSTGGTQSIHTRVTVQSRTTLPDEPISLKITDSTDGFQSTETIKTSHASNTMTSSPFSSTTAGSGSSTSEITTGEQRSKRTMTATTKTTTADAAQTTLVREELTGTSGGLTVPTTLLQSSTVFETDRATSPRAPTTNWNETPVLSTSWTATTTSSSTSDRGSTIGRSHATEISSPSASAATQLSTTGERDLTGTKQSSGYPSTRATPLDPGTTMRGTSSATLQQTSAATPSTVTMRVTPSPRLTSIPPHTTRGAGNTGSSIPWWAILMMILGSTSLFTILSSCLFCCCFRFYAGGRRKRDRDDDELESSAPATVESSVIYNPTASIVPDVEAGSSSYDDIAELDFDGELTLF